MHFCGENCQKWLGESEALQIHTIHFKSFTTCMIYFMEGLLYYLGPKPRFFWKFLCFLLISDMHHGEPYLLYFPDDLWFILWEQVSYYYIFQYVWSNFQIFSNFLKWKENYKLLFLSFNLLNFVAKMFSTFKIIVKISYLWIVVNLHCKYMCNGIMATHETFYFIHQTNYCFNWNFKFETRVGDDLYR